MTAQRNQALGQSRADVFERYYISRKVNVDIQSAYLGTAPRSDLLMAIGRMSLSSDPRAPKSLNEEQKRQAHSAPEVLRLQSLRDEKKIEIKSLYKIVKEAKGTPLYDEYQVLNREVNTEKIFQTKLKMREVRQTYFANVNEIEIARQLSGRSVAAPAVLNTRPIQYPFPERARLAKALFGSTIADIREHRVSAIEDLVRLCSLREVPRSNSSPEPLTTASKEIKVGHSVKYPILYPSSQCLFCLGNASLNESARVSMFSRIDSLRRHKENKHFRHLNPNKLLACPHPACSAMLDILLLRSRA